MSISDHGEVKQISQNVSDSPVSAHDQGEKGLKIAILNGEKKQNSINYRVLEPAKAAESRRFSFNSDGKPKTFFKISSANSGKKEKAENFNDKEKEESFSDEFEKNSQHEEISYSENIDEIICANNKDCSNKESRSSVNRIFTTTVIEKGKKSINFKVIKNRERYNSTNTVNSVNFNSNASNNNSYNNTACNTNVNNNPLNSIPNLFTNGAAANSENNHNNVNNNLTSDLNLNNIVNSNSTSSDSVVDNLNSISNLNLNSISNLNLHNNNKINFNNNSINTQNTNSNSNLLNNNNNMDDLNFYNKNLGHGKAKSITRLKNRAKTNRINSNIAYLENNKENFNSFSENHNSNALIENNNNNNFIINNNLNNPNMKNSKNNMNAGKQQVFDLNSLGSQNGYVNTQSNYNYTQKNIPNLTQSVNASSVNPQMQFFGNGNPQEFFNDSNSQTLNANAGIANQNMRSYAQQNYAAYQSQNFAFYEKENLAAAAAQNFNNFNNYYSTAENFNKKRNKENEENLNFNSLYLNSANFGNSVAMRQQPHNIYSNAMQQSYLNPYSHQYNANLPYGVPGMNGAFPGSAVTMGMNDLSSPGRKPLRFKENYIEELLVAVEECINRGIYEENSPPAQNQTLSNGNHENKNRLKNLEACDVNNHKANEIQNPFSNKEQSNINISITENDNYSLKNNNNELKDKQANNNNNNNKNKKSKANKEEKEDLNNINDNSSSNNQNEEKQKNSNKNNNNNNNISKSNSNDDSSVCLNSEKNNNHKKSPSNECNKLKNNLMINLDNLSNNLNLDLNENNKSTPDDEINSNASSKYSKNDKSSVKKNEESFIDFSSCKENKKGNNFNNNGNNYSSLSNNGRGNHKQRETNITKCENKYCQFDNNSKKKQVITKRKIGSKSIMVCQNCLKAYNNGKFCRWCYTTYKENTNAHEDGKDWVQCDAENCISWHHIHCEERKGNYSNLTGNLKDKDFKYYCPDCKPKYDNNTPLSKSKKLAAPNDSFLKKKRAAVKSNSLLNVYRKEYDFAFKHSKSKRIKEKMKQLEKIKDKDKTSEKEVLNSPSNPNTRNFTSLGRTDKNRNNPPSSRDGELIRRSRTKNKGSSRSLNCNMGNGFNNFNDLFVYDQRLKTKRNRAESCLEDDAKDFGNDVKKLNERFNKEN